MRRFVVPLVVVALAAAAAPASAQDDGCTESEPCPWFIEVNADGFVDNEWNWGQGDVFSIEVLVDDNATHQLVLEGYDLTIDAPGYDDPDGPYSEHGTITLDQAGTFTFRDETTGATATVNVEAPAADDSDGAADGSDGADGAMDNGDGSNGTPWAATTLVILSVAAIAAVTRSRRR